MTILLLIFAVLVSAALFMGIRIVPQSQAMIVERLGRFHRVLESGLNVIVPFLDSSRPMHLMRQGHVTQSNHIDLREQIMGFEKVPVITMDNVTMEVGTVIYYQVIDPVRAVYEIENLPRAIYELTQTNIRNVMGSLSLDETLTSRDTLNTRLRMVLDEATEKWGVKVTRVELKEIEPPIEIRDAMALQMTAERKRRAHVTEAEGLKSAEILRAQGQQEAKVLQAKAEKEARVLQAEAEKTAVILRAEAEKASELMNAEAGRDATTLRAEGAARAKALLAGGEAEAIRQVFEAIHTGKATPDVLAIRYLETLEAIANGPANKLFIPYEASAFASALGGIKEVMSSATGEPRLENRAVARDG